MGVSTCPNILERTNRFIKGKCVHCEILTLNSAVVLFGKDNNTKADDCFQHILLTAKYYVYKWRFNKVKPNIDSENILIFKDFYFVKVYNFISFKGNFLDY